MLITPQLRGERPSSVYATFENVDCAVSVSCGVPRRTGPDAWKNSRLGGAVLARKVKGGRHDEEDANDC